VYHLEKFLSSSPAISGSSFFNDRITDSRVQRIDGCSTFDGQSIIRDSLVKGFQNLAEYLVYLLRFLSKTYFFEHFSV